MVSAGAMAISKDELRQYGPAFSSWEERYHSMQETGCELNKAFSVPGWEHTDCTYYADRELIIWKDTLEYKIFFRR